MPNTQNQNPSTQNQPQPDANADMLQKMQTQLDEQAKLIAQLSSKSAPKAKQDSGTVRVLQKRIVRNEGGILETHDEQEQTYSGDVFDRMMVEDEDGRNMFAHMGYAAPEVLEDSRQKKK